jgi:hypothetical protein
MDVYYEAAAITLTLTGGPGVTVKSQGTPDSKLQIGQGGVASVTIKLCKSCGCGCPGGGCGCLSIVPTLNTTK